MSRRVCSQGHVWVMFSDTVSCARCYQSLSVLRMLEAYLRINPEDEGFQRESGDGRRAEKWRS